jgi:futalosine hydrolase
MISLLAAVPQETTLIRAALAEASEETLNGLTFYRGQISGVDVCLTHSGIGKAAAAAATTTLLLNYSPEELWLFGCGGAYLNSGLQIGDLALASSEIFGDEGVVSREGFQDLSTMDLTMRDNTGFSNTWPVDTQLCEWAKQILETSCGPFVTVSTCTGTTEQSLEIEQRTKGLCENMEGAAAALACHQLSVPMLELRGISNMVEDRDTSRWDLPGGMNAAQNAILTLLEKWSQK